MKYIMTIYSTGVFKQIFSSLLLLVILASSARIIAQGPVCRSEAKIDVVQDIYGLSGAGVLTIMMDRGIDYRHPDFIDSNGKTRIAYILDLYDNSGANDSDNSLGVGTIYDRDEINAALAAGGPPISNDIFGHGTATTGIMSGNGSAVAGGQFQGVASNATIISIVVTKDFVPPFGGSSGQAGMYDPTLLPFAFQFAEEKINELNLPSVSLLNIGSIQDPTDGSLAFCDMVDDFTSNGNTFVCGVGDDGGKDNHMIIDLFENQSTEIIISKNEAGNLRFAAWYSEDEQFDFTISRVNGTTEGPFPSPIGPNDVQDNFLSDISITHRGKNVETAGSNSDLQMLIIDFFGNTPDQYTITINPINLNGSGRMNAFLNPALYYNSNGFVNNNNPGGNIHSFSACPAVISPGDYVATNRWTDINRVQRTRSGEGLPGELWLGSSIGPTMDGRLGIDLAAPGELAWAAYGQDSYYASFEFNLLENSQGFYGLQTAVSAAAPIVAGVIALMLEVNPNLRPSEIKSILQSSSRQDGFTGSVPNNSWGYGKLDAEEAIEQTFITVSTKEVKADETSALSISPNPVNDFVRVHTSLSTTKPQQISIKALDGRTIMTAVQQSGDLLDVSTIHSGVYIVQVHSEGTIIQGLMVKQ